MIDLLIIKVFAALAVLIFIALVTIVFFFFLLVSLVWLARVWKDENC